MRRVLLVVLALLLSGCGAQAARSAPATQPSPAPSASACRGFVVLGFRGQGQSPHTRHGFGREVDQVVQAVVDRFRGTRVRLARPRFPARDGDSSYDADVATAVASAGRVIRSTCDRIVLVGYSQGAEVVHRVAVAHPRRVALAVLMGDPLRNPDEPVATFALGTGSLDGRGNGGPGARFPGVVRRHVLEVCAQADDVCNAPLTGRVGAPSAAHHVAYQDGDTARAIAARAVALAAGS